MFLSAAGPRTASRATGTPTAGSFTPSPTERPLVVAVYVELHTASAFSFLQGASLPEALATRAAALGYPAVALLDRDGVYGAPRFHKAALAAGIRPLIGAELTIGDGGGLDRHWLLPVLC